jgi:hypothetical protein
MCTTSTEVQEGEHDSLRGFWARDRISTKTRAFPVRSGKRENVRVMGREFFSSFHQLAIVSRIQTSVFNLISLHFLHFYHEMNPFPHFGPSGPD